MRELKNRKVKFPLKMGDDVRVRRIEELRSHSGLEDQKLILSYYAQGKLEIWLRDRYYDEMADQVAELDPNDAGLAENLFHILGLECTSISKQLDLSEIQAGNQKRKRVQEITDNKEIIDHYELVAFNDEELNALMANPDVDRVYLCGTVFTPAYVNRSIHLIGINKPKIHFKNHQYVDFEKAGFVFENTTWDLCFLSLGETITFGKFDGKPLTWLVLKKERGKLLVMATNNVCQKSFNKYSNSWEESSIRKWLNQEFYRSAFSVLEREHILCSEITTETPYGQQYPSSIEKIPMTKTNDYIFLPDRDLINNVDISVLNKEEFWLRNPHLGYKKTYTAHEYNEKLHLFENHVTTIQGIRPAMYLRTD